MSPKEELKQIKEKRNRAAKIGNAAMRKKYGAKQRSEWARLGGVAKSKLAK